MKRTDLPRLIEKAEEMAIGNVWGEDAHKINSAILLIDKNNTAACTRLAKNYKLDRNVEAAKDMYIRTLEIDPSNRGAINNLIDIEKDQKENEAVDKLKTGKELYSSGETSLRKGKYELAAKFLKKAYNVEPLFKYAVCLAGVYKKMGKSNKIDELYKMVIDTNPEKTDAELIDAGFAAFLNKK